MNPWWIHCNICSSLLNKDNRQFLLSCNHIFCQNCMKHTDRGKKCPLCKTNIRFMDITRLPSHLKENFQDDPGKMFNAPLKILKFRQCHQHHLSKGSRDYKIKCMKAKQAFEKMEADNNQLKVQLQEMIRKRKLMQAKLKEIYTQQQMQKKSQRYRSNSVLSGISSSPRTVSTREDSSFFLSDPPFMHNNSSNLSNQTSSSSGFFEKLCRSSTDSRSFEMFGTSSSNGSTPKLFKNSRRLSNERSQSDRKPFFS